MELGNRAEGVSRTNWMHLMCLAGKSEEEPIVASLVVVVVAVGASKWEGEVDSMEAFVD